MQAVDGKERKEGNVLFNDALNTFYLRLYGVGHMVKDHSDSERGNPHWITLRRDLMSELHLVLFPLLMEWISLRKTQICY